MIYIFFYVLINKMALNDIVRGIFPFQEIQEMRNTGIISTNDSTIKINDEEIQPSSLDIRVQDIAYIVPKGFRPAKDQKIDDARKSLTDSKTINLEKGALLNPCPYDKEGGFVYLIPIEEKLALPRGFRGHANPKSSTGRIDLNIRLLVDGCPEYDEIPYNYEGPIYILLEPGWFSVVLYPLISLNQIRFYFGKRSEIEVDDQSLCREYQKHKMLYGYDNNPIYINEDHFDRGLKLGINLSQDRVYGIALKAKQTPEPIDLSKKEYYSVNDFFDSIKKEDLKNGMLHMETGDFYLIASDSLVRIPPGFAGEMVPYLVEAGEVRTHEAGFFDEGFGYGKNGEVLGSSAVLEMKARRFETYTNGQMVSKIVLEYMRDISTKVYGEKGSHYQGQRSIRPAKYFKQDLN